MKSARIIREGVWFYEKVSPATIRIDEVDLLPGSGDYQDPPEVREDREGTFYRVSSTAPGGAAFSCIRGYFASLEEAKASVEREFFGITWRE